MRLSGALLATAITLLLPIVARAATASPVPVTVENFVRAETDRYFAGVVKLAGGTGRFMHRRAFEAIDKQYVVRANRDTLYSSAVIDLDAGPVTVTLPEAGGRFRSLMVINEDGYVPAVVYSAGKHTFTREEMGTRYVMLGLRTFADPTDADELAGARALQDASRIDQPQGTGSFEAPAWDPASQKLVRDALLVLAETLPDADRGFGRKGEVDPVRHLLLSASAWGGNPDHDAKYLNIVPEHNDGSRVYRLVVDDDVPVDGFWSISVYDALGRFIPNPGEAYTLNNVTAHKADDGSITVQFGGCGDKAVNCLPVAPGWNYMVRLYRPRQEILNGSWRFPKAELMP